MKKIKFYIIVVNKIYFWLIKLKKIISTYNLFFIVFIIHEDGAIFTVTKVPQFYSNYSDKTYFPIYIRKFIVYI